MLFGLLGGIGFFLLGMTLLSDGLRSFAGNALREALMRFTGTPLKAFGSGALVTAIVQSSSATTITLIGFVSAGLLTFPQAIGVVFGASLGTTATGWIVSVLGLRISVGFYALPLIGVGAFMKLLARGRWKFLGLALAGFGLIFVGIDTLQQGMRGLTEQFDLSGLPATGWQAAVLALAIGFVLTVVLQSSSAAVATTLTALHAHSVSFEQAAFLVIGAAVGTTVKGALVTIGGSVPAKRTALAHILFNLSTGIIALLLLPLFLWGVRQAQVRLGWEADATSLAAFHTLFILVGVMVFLPMAQPFARWIERIVPDRGAPWTAYLDNSLLNIPDVAMESAWRALNGTSVALFGVLRDALDSQFSARAGIDRRHIEIQQALDRIRNFISRIPPLMEGSPMATAREPQMHTMDHLARLQSIAQPPEETRRRLTDERISPAAKLCRAILTLAITGPNDDEINEWLTLIERRAGELAVLRRNDRPAVLRHAADRGRDPAEALEILETMRWLDQVGYHTWRICLHLRQHDHPAPMDEPHTTLQPGPESHTQPA